MDLYIILCKYIGIAIVSGFLTFILFYFISFIYIMLHRSISFWILSLKADKFHNGKVVKSPFRKSKFYKIKLLFLIIKAHGLKFAMFGKKDSMSNEFLYWSPSKKYIKNSW